jgi:hypothetical protein
MTLAGAIIQPTRSPGNAIFDDRNLKAGGEFEHPAAFGDWHRGPRRIVEVRRKNDHLHAVLHQNEFHRRHVHAGDRAGAGFGSYRRAQDSHTGPREDRQRAGVGRVFYQNCIARPQESLAKQVQGLLAPVRDQQILIRAFVTFAPQHGDQSLFEAGIPVGGAKLQYLRAFFPPYRIRTIPQVLDRKKLRCRPGQHKRDYSARLCLTHPAQNFVSPFIRE